MFKLGDFVRFVDEKREGYVTRIIDGATLGVTDTDGFEIPVAIANLTHVHGHETKNKAGTTAEIADTGSNDSFNEFGIYLAIAPELKNSSVAHFYVINQTSYQLLMTVSTEQKGLFKGIFSGVVQPQTSTQVLSANFGDLELWPSYIFQVLFFTVNNLKPKIPLNLTKKIRAKDLSGAKEKISAINSYAWMIQLDEQPPVIDAQKLKESFFRPSEEKKVVGRPPDTVDLHIEKLRDDHQFLGQAEIIDVQLHYFHQMLDAAIVHQLPSIIFIHGVGNGTLRHQIHKTISKHSQVRTFMDAQKEKFGFGATQVFFKN